LLALLLASRLLLGQVDRVATSFACETVLRRGLCCCAALAAVVGAAFWKFRIIQEAEEWAMAPKPGAG
jgi:hypothetical protein